MKPLPNPQRPLVLSYLELRQAIGVIGCSLPFVLALGKWFTQAPGLQSSISCYYYTDMRNILVGSLCAIGVFLLSIRGYDRRDQIAGALASIFAIGTALFPENLCTSSSPPHKFIGELHLTFAALLFITFSYLSLALFTETYPGIPPTPRKLQRNVVYRICGWTILACIVLIAAVKLTPLSAALQSVEPVFWLESVAVVAFGFSWLTKGQMILKDK